MQDALRPNLAHLLTGVSKMGEQVAGSGRAAYVDPRPPTWVQTDTATFLPPSRVAWLVAPDPAE